MRMTHTNPLPPLHTHTHTLYRNLLISAVNNVMFSSPFMLLGPFSLSRAPSLPLLPGCPGDRVSERHFFPEAPLSLSHGFVQLALLTGSWMEERRGGESSQKASYTSLEDSGRAWRDFMIESKQAWGWLYFNSAGFM